MQLRGEVVDVGERRTVDTTYGDRDLCELRVRPRADADAIRVTLWGDWAETADYLEAGSDVAVYGADRETFQGDLQCSVGSDAMIVVEPDVVVDVTDVRQWVQCPRMYYLNKIGGTDHAYPVVKGTIVHQVFGDLLRGQELESAIEERVDEAGLDLGLLGRDAGEVTETVREHGSALAAWLEQGRLDEDEWRSEMTLVSPRFAMKGRADAVRNGAPVELKTGKNTRRDPRFHDKIQATCYALLLADRAARDVEDGDGGDAGTGDDEAGTGEGDAGTGDDGTGSDVAADGSGQTELGDVADDSSAADAAADDEGVDGTATDDEGELLPDLPDTGTLLYTKNAALAADEADGDLSPAKDFTIGRGLVDFVVRTRNELAAMEARTGVPTGYEADAKCEYCFEQDTCMAVSGRLDQESKAGAVGSPVPEAEREYFDRYYDAIEAERRAVHREYAKLWTQTPEERADADRALVNLEPQGRRQLDGGRWELRATTTGAVSKLREGDVALASDGDPIRGAAELCRIERLDDEVVVTTDEPLALRRLDVYPSEIGPDRMLTALHDAVLLQSDAEKDVLFGRADPAFDPPAVQQGHFVPNNDAQDRAVERAVAAEDFALVHGPPGTGKTYTLASIVDACVERGDRVLLSAFTNRAVDNCIEALEAQGVTDVVRMGTESGVGPAGEPYRLDTSGDPETCLAALEDAAVVAATTATCCSRVLRTQSFDTAVVDEAGQLTEPGTLAAVARADRFVLVGDHRQLPPVVTADDETLATSLFERLIDEHPEAGVTLDRQYRMAQRIQAFPSREFYDGRLRPADGAVAAQTLGDLDGVDPDYLPADLQDRVAFRDPDGVQQGHANHDEAAAVGDAVDQYLAAGVDPTDVGVIAPFRAQVGAIGDRLPEGVTVDTVDRFQGSSKEVIVVSFVATGSLDGPIFEDYRRINVALTRAKKSLLLVGDPDALGTDPVYERMVEWARSD